MMHIHSCVSTNVEMEEAALIMQLFGHTGDIRTRYTSKQFDQSFACAESEADMANMEYNIRYIPRIYHSHERKHKKKFIKLPL